MPEGGHSAMARILVVDDSPPNVKLLRLILGDAGYQVLEAYGGPEALDILRREEPDAMILDVRMPGMTGYEVCKQVRLDARFASLPVIMVTALSLQEERIRGIEAGATDFISKPFNKKELLARVRASLVIAKNGRNGIVPQLPGAVLITDPDWKILAMSPLATVLLETPSPGIMELDFAQFLGQEEREAVATENESTEFSLHSPTDLKARQLAVRDATGHLILRLIVLNEIP
jgi:two-component system, cell cycle response regulator